METEKAAAFGRWVMQVSGLTAAPDEVTAIAASDIATLIADLPPCDAEFGGFFVAPQFAAHIIRLKEIRPVLAQMIRRMRRAGMTNATTRRAAQRGWSALCDAAERSA